MILIKKAIRSMLRNKKAYLSCILLMSLGVALYISFNTSILNLSIARDNFYNGYRLADIFAKVNGIGENDIDKINKIEGIEEVVPRVVNNFRIEHKDIETLMTIAITSSDLNYKGNTINQYTIYEGRDIIESTDILLNVDFIKLNNINIGDEVTIIYNGKTIDFKVVGSVMSPEYVFFTRDTRELLPDKKSFGFGYLSLDMMKIISNSNNTYNDLVITLNDDYNFNDVKTELTDTLNNYDLTSLIPQKDQLSFNMFNSEIEGLKSQSTAIPMAFLTMVSAILYLTLKRVIEQERMEIGMLKAFGYTNFEILKHYLIYGIITGVFGGILGCILGYNMSSALLSTYLEYYLLPLDSSYFTVTPFYIGFVLAICCSIISTFFGVKKLLKLSPVDSMKSEVPIVNIKSTFINNSIFKIIFKTSGFMALRNIQRNKLRSLFIILGISVSFAMAAYTASLTNLMDGMIFVQLNNVKKYDAKFTFFNPVDESTLHYVQDFDGVTLADGIYELPVNLRYKDNSTASMLLGLKPNTSLYKIYDEKLKSNKTLTSDGIILCNYYADLLNVKKGDYVYIDSPLLDESIKIKVTDISHLTLADATYIDINTLYKLFNLSGYTSIIFNSDNYNVIKNNFTTASNVSSIEDKETTNNNLKEMMQSYNIIFDFLTVTTVVIVFIVIYNISTIAFSERSREYATLKVMGITTNEIAEIVNLEFWILTFIGLFFGIFLAIALKISINNLIDIDNFSFDVKVYPYEILSASIQCSLAVFLSNFMNKKNIKKLDLVTVLKER